MHFYENKPLHTSISVRCSAHLCTDRISSNFLKVLSFSSHCQKIVESVWKKITLSYMVWYDTRVSNFVVELVFNKNGLLIKLFCFWSYFDETWWDCSTHAYYNLTKFHQSRIKNKKLLLIAHFCWKPIQQQNWIL